MEDVSEINEKKESKINDRVPEAVMKDIEKTCCRIDGMPLREVINKLKCFSLKAEGSQNILRENLKNSYKKILLAGKDLSLSKDLLPFYVVVDFEATCDGKDHLKFRPEIIEFPGVLVNTKEQRIVDHFQMYCKPQINPTLSDYCTILTGITQEQVDSAETFDKVLAHFYDWLAKHKLQFEKNFIIVTDGQWDMSRYLYGQCNYSKVKFPKWGRKWVNLKREFARFYGKGKLNHSLTSMLNYLNLEFEGNHHCGLDDSKNIAKILLRMIYDGATIQANERITGMKKLRLKANKNKDENDTAELNCDTQPPRIEAYLAPISYREQTTYKRKRRERLIAEAQLARKILKVPNES